MGIMLRIKLFIIILAILLFSVSAIAMIRIGELPGVSITGGLNMGSPSIGDPSGVVETKGYITYEDTGGIVYKDTGGIVYKDY